VLRRAPEAPEEQQVERLLRWVRAPILLALLLALVLPALAQGSLIVRDDASFLDRSQVERAAQPLVNRGAIVAVYAANSGTSSEFDRRLAQDQLLRSGKVPKNLIAIFVSLKDRYSSIRYGDDWAPALASRYESIRTDQLNKGLSATSFTSGVVSALGAISTAVGSGSSSSSGSSGGVPSSSGGATAPSGGSSSPWNLLGCVGILALLGGGAWFWQRSSASRAAAAVVSGARDAAEEARKRAGAAVSDLAQHIREARDRAQFDRVSYPAEDAAEMAAMQQDAEQRFVQIQERFSATEDAIKQKAQPGEADYQQATASYSALPNLADDVRALLDQIQARRNELDKAGASAPQDVDRAKKALADVTERLGALSDDFPSPQPILSAAAAQVARAESLLEERRGAQASQAAAEASAQIEALAQTVSRYADIREGLSAGRAAAQKVTAQGFRVEAGLAAFDAAEAALRQAGADLARGGPAAAEAALAAAEQKRAEGVARGGGMPALMRANQERFAQVQQAGEQLAGHLEQGRRTFASAQEFAESTWSDIRGNGSEAEASAKRAHLLWEEAQQLNTMEAQDFFGAQQRLDAAEAEIARAHALVDAVVQRLKDLESARDSAQQEIAAAQADIQTGWEYVRSNDADVGKAPEELLARAAQRLQLATQEMEQPRPDWLALLRAAQEANQLADQALAGARGEVEAMNALREQVQRAQQVAAAEVQKTAQFAALHREDLRGSEGELDRLQAQVQDAYQALQAVERTEEQARADALRAVLKRYNELRDAADQVYARLYESFQRVDGLRQRIAGEVNSAQDAIRRAEAELQTYAAYIPAGSDGLRSLESARSTLAQIASMRVQDQADADRVAALAGQARASAEHAEQVLRAQGQAGQRAPQYQQSGGGMGDFVAGALLGSALSGGRDHHHHSGWGSGGGGSWGSGGGDSGWSVGGGGGGSWGDSGGGGGGWGDSGGGGDSGGSWGDSGGGGGGW
jgi:F0F1-type ATP synthase membrane subunit b/b'